MGTLRGHVQAGAAAPMLRGLVRAPARGGRSAADGALARRLAAAAEAERAGIALETLRGEVAAVLGHGGPETIAPDRAFKELGFDSLAAVELRNRLNTLTGMRLPAALIFNHPTPGELAAELCRLVAPAGGEAPAAASDDERVREVLASIPVERLRDAGLLDALMRLAGGDGAGEESGDGTPEIDTLDVADLVRRAREGVDDPIEAG